MNNLHKMLHEILEYMIMQIEVLWILWNDLTLLLFDKFLWLILV